MATKFAVLVSQRFYYGVYEMDTQTTGNITACTWTVFTTPIVNGEYLDELTEIHDFPAKPTNRQLRKLKKIAYRVLEEDIWK